MQQKAHLTVNSTTEAEQLFKPHGTYEGVVADRIVVEHVTGPFNREMILALAKGIGELYRTLDTNKPVGGITIFHENMMFTTDAIDAVRDLIAHELRLMPHGIVVAHVVGAEVEGRQLIPPLLAKNVYGRFNIPYRCFDNLDDAQTWVRAQIG